MCRTPADRQQAPVRECSECGRVGETYRGRASLCRECGRRQQGIVWENWTRGLRRCTRCKEFKPHGAFRMATKGLRRFCTVCEDAAASVATLECRICHQILPRALFSVQKHYTDRRCRACNSQRTLRQSKMEKHAVQRRKQRRGRYQADHEYRTMYQVRSAVRRAWAGGYKRERTLELLGCSMEDFRAHIESRFAEGMTWDCFRRNAERPAEIDHIRPLASFALSDAAQRREAMSFENCQPLWQRDNRTKSDFLPDGTRGRDAPAGGGKWAPREP